MKILNKNTNGTRNRALSELEVMQELTPGDKNYGKIAIGTDGTYDGEVLIAKDSDMQGILAGSIGNINSPLLDLPLNNSLAMKQGVGSVTFSRDTKATYIDRYGVLQSADIDEPRFEKDGLLIEGVSTNLQIYSEEFDNDAWTKSACSIASDDAVKDLYGNDAYKISQTTEENYHRIYAGTLTLSSDDKYTVSAYLKAGTHDIFYFNSGVLGIGLSEVNLTAKTATMGVLTEMKDGWFRLSYTGTGSDNVSRIYIGIGVDGSYAGDDTLNAYISGVQIEKLPFASSYIPTTDSAVTRSADYTIIDTKNGNNTSPSNNITFSTEFSIAGFANLYPRIMDFGATLLGITKSSGNSYFDSGALESLQATPIINTNTNYAIVGTSSNTESAIYLAGVKYETRQEDENYDNYERILSLGGKPTSDVRHLFGHIKRFKIYDMVLTPTEIQLLSGGN